MTDILFPDSNESSRSETKFGLGLPLALRPKENIIPYTRVNFAGRPIYQLGISFFKIALLISYLRLFKGTNQKIYRRVVIATIVLIFLGHLGCSFSLIFACNPVIPHTHTSSQLTVSLLTRRVG